VRGRNGTGAQLRPPLVDVTDEVLAGFLDELEVAQQPPGPGLVLGDRAAGGGDLPLAVLSGGVVEFAEAGVQEVFAVGAEDLVARNSDRPSSRWSSRR
jgi:hypothetical protein